jgi:hypothetical protein
VVAQFFGIRVAVGSRVHRSKYGLMVDQLGIIGMADWHAISNGKGQSSLPEAIQAIFSDRLSVASAEHGLTALNSGTVPSIQPQP